MKNLFLLIGFVFLGMSQVNAQACKKASSSCCANKAASAATTSETKVASASMEAEITEAQEMASKDESIESRVNASTGEVSFFQKSTCAHSGSTKWTEVEYCTKSKKFTQVASASMESDIETAETVKDTKEAKKSCSKDGAAKACCKDKAKEGKKAENK